LVLTVDAGPASGTVFEVGEAGATLGRTSDNLVYILDQGLSRVHARFECRDGGYWLLDLASTNGTFVNQQRVDSPRRLDAGDVIRVGRSRLLVGMKDEG
jgi:pSer/pThr/pTyr-binding forkhead associated (FHA) protein